MASNQPHSWSDVGPVVSVRVSMTLHQSLYKYGMILHLSIFVCLVGFLTVLSTTRLHRGRDPRLTSDNFTCCHTRDRAGRS